MSDVRATECEAPARRFPRRECSIPGPRRRVLPLQVLTVLFRPRLRRFLPGSPGIVPIYRLPVLQVSCLRLTEKIGQMVLVGLDGYEVDDRVVSRGSLVADQRFHHIIPVGSDPIFIFPNLSDTEPHPFV